MVFYLLILLAESIKNSPFESHCSLDMRAMILIDIIYSGHVQNDFCKPWNEIMRISRESTFNKPSIILEVKLPLMLLPKSNDKGRFCNTIAAKLP